MVAVSGGSTCCDGRSALAVAVTVIVRGPSELNPRLMLQPFEGKPKSVGSELVHVQVTGPGPGSGPSFTSVASARNCVRTVRWMVAPLEGAENKYRFVRYIERTENISILKKPKKALPQDVKK